MRPPNAAFPSPPPLEFVNIGGELLSIIYPLRYLPMYGGRRGGREWREKRNRIPRLARPPISFLLFLGVKSIISKPLEMRHFAEIHRSRVPHQVTPPIGPPSSVSPAFCLLEWGGRTCGCFWKRATPPPSLGSHVTSSSSSADSRGRSKQPMGVERIEATSGYRLWKSNLWRRNIKFTLGIEAQPGLDLSHTWGRGEPTNRLI